MPSLKQKLHTLRSYLQLSSFSTFSLLLATGLIAFTYALLEWIFIITKPSALTTIHGYEKGLLLFNFGILLVLACLILLLPLALYALISKKKPHPVVLNIFSTVPTFVLATLVLMLIDNFTYTVFNFGIISASGFYRLIYTALYLFLFFALYRPVIGFIRFVDEVYIVRPTGTWGFGTIMLSLLLVLGIMVPLLLNRSEEIEAYETDGQTELDVMPNILLITVDGLNASNMSLYGFEMETTPFLEKLAPVSLLAENAFANAQGTIGSISSLLTGKYPIDLHVLYSSEVLKGIDATQHLPGLLKKYGYNTVQLTYSHYADAYTHNLQGAFDIASGRTYPSGGWLMQAITAIFPEDFKIFLQEAIERPFTRLGHLFFLLDMDNPYKQVTEEGITKAPEQQKIDEALAILREAEQPTFIHIHWMGTHGPKYFPNEQVFSAGESLEAQQKYENEFYYDSILDFDRHFEELYTILEEEGILNNTVIILASDHTQKWTNGRILLMMLFPGNEYAQTIIPNVQNLDIAPTILDYLDINQPSWMAGDSLLNGLSETRPIFTAKIPKSIKDKITGKVTYPESTAPFYQFGRMSVILCDTWYELDTTALVMTQGKIVDHVGDCQTDSGSMQEALELLSQHFKEYGYDPSSLYKTVFDQE